MKRIIFAWVAVLAAVAATEQKAAANSSGGFSIGVGVDLSFRYKCWQNHPPCGPQCSDGGGYFGYSGWGYGPAYPPPYAAGPGYAPRYAPAAAYGPPPPAAAPTAPAAAPKPAAQPTTQQINYQYYPTSGYNYQPTYNYGYGYGYNYAPVYWYGY